MALFFKHSIRDTEPNRAEVGARVYIKPGILVLVYLEVAHRSSLEVIVAFTLPDDFALTTTSNLPCGQSSFYYMNNAPWYVCNLVLNIFSLDEVGRVCPRILWRWLKGRNLTVARMSYFNPTRHTTFCAAYLFLE